MAPKTSRRNLYLGLLKNLLCSSMTTMFYLCGKKTKIKKYTVWAPSLPEATCTDAKSNRGGQISRFFTLFMTSVALTVLLRFFLHEIILNRK